MRPISKKTLTRNRWWSLFNSAANFAYDLSSGRYMRSGGASTQALSLTGVPSGQPVQGVGMTVGAADNPVVVQGLGDEQLFYADNPQLWGPTGGTRVDNPDGTADMVSQGATWHRLQAETALWQAGVKMRGFKHYKEGTSGRIRLTLRNNSDAQESAAVGEVGALVVQQNAAGPLEIISQELVGDLHTVHYYFTPNASPASRSAAIGPDSTTVGETVKAVGGSLKQVFPYPGYNADGTLSGWDLVEGGATDKTVASLGSTDGQNARLLTGSSGTEQDRLWNNGGFWARTITLGGVDATVTSAVPWVAGDHTVYVETTQTDDDGFIAYWLDGVFLSELSYQGVLPLIDSFPLGPVAGVKTIKQVYGK